MPEIKSVVCIECNSKQTYVTKTEVVCRNCGGRTSNKKKAQKQ